MYLSQISVLKIICVAFLCCGFGAPLCMAQTAQSAWAQTLDGKTVDPFKSSEGRVVVLLFVRTDCPISNRYAPAIQKLHEKFHGKVNFWLVYPDAGETAARIRAHDEEFHLSIPALRDVHRELVERSHATITPESAVFDTAGKLIYHGRIDNWYEDFGRARSAPTTHELEDAIRNTLNGNATVPDHADAVGCYISDLR
jgi:thiol-disulfide isomerase/thioredoxin